MPPLKGANFRFFESMSPTNTSKVCKPFNHGHKLWTQYTKVKFQTAIEVAFMAKKLSHA